ncbi:MAG: DUF3450 family protein [Verrucomicrobiales bacterium]|nr:DUF3450 family protein [Verrucomicrobiales bacterium]
MDGWRQWALVASAALACAAWAAGTGESALGETRTTLEQWVQTHQLLSRTRADWAKDQDLLEQTRALFQRELKSLDEQVARLETNQVAMAGERTAAEAQDTLFRAALDGVRGPLAQVETRIKTLEPIFPPVLRSTLQPLLNRLPTTPQPTNVTVAARLQAVLTLLSEIDKFNGTLTLVEETRPGPQGKAVAVDVLYAGLAQAWFVDKTATFAGVGIPGPTGWNWTSRPEVANAVARAIRVYRNELPAAFVALPLELP